MSDISKLLIFGLAYHTNKHAFESGMALLKKQNKTQEEKVAAKSFKKIMIRVGITFSFALFSIILATVNFMLSLVFLDSSPNYVGVSMMVLLSLMIISPILIVISALMLRSTSAREWINYYNSHCKSL